MPGLIKVTCLPILIRPGILFVYSYASPMPTQLITRAEDLPKSLADIKDEHHVRMLLTPRHGIVAPKGYSIVSLDYKNQEVYIAAWVTQDPKFLAVFTEPETLLINGVEYKNPQADLHTLTAAYCCFPNLFNGQPEYLWRGIADNPDLIRQKGNARDYGKKANFGS